MISKLLITAFLIGLHLKETTQISQASDPSYYAGVVEFQPSKTGTAKERVYNNLQRIKGIIESNDARDLDIIVFPEGILNNDDMKTYIPDPALRISPCIIADYDYFMSQISCAARSRQLYVVINVVEKEYCAIDGYPETCSTSGFNTYNTNVVFDRQGRVISRYRKSHLYRNEWHRVNIRSKPEVAIFETDFGVRFGHFICFDMLFYEPQQSLIKDYNITDIIYPTYWFSELPFLTAVQLQAGYSFANDVNLLAACGSLPAEQNTGSGIFAGRLGRLQAAIYENPTTILLKARVPKHDRRDDYQVPPLIVPQFLPQVETPRFTKLSLLRDYNLDIFTTKLLDTDFTMVNETQCHGEFCCQFQVQRQFISSSNIHTSYRYRLVAYDGAQATFQSMDPSELAVCALVACTGEELYTCGHIFPESTLVGNKYYFSSINIKASVRNSPRRNIYPSTVDGVMMPLPISMFSWEEQTKSLVTDVIMNLLSPKSDLLTFGIWTNYYSTAIAKHNLDPIKPIRSGSESFVISRLCYILSISTLFWTVKGINIY